MACDAPAQAASPDPTPAVRDPTRLLTPCRSENDVNRLRIAGLVLGAWVFAALGLYELAAKAPADIAARWPGRRAARQAEAATRWRPPTGLMPVDKVLHEGEEAARFYATLAGFRPPGRVHER